VAAFTAYTAESPSRGVTWTLISEAAVYEAERYRRALGDITPITQTDLWARVAEDMSQKPYKTLAGRPPGGSRRGPRAGRGHLHPLPPDAGDRPARQSDNRNFGHDMLRYLRSLAINTGLSRHLGAFDRAIAENGTLIRDVLPAQQAADHLRSPRAETADAKRRIEKAASSTGPGA
jgi:hypothetical protein